MKIFHAFLIIFLVNFVSNVSSQLRTQDNSLPLNPDASVPLDLGTSAQSEGNGNNKMVVCLIRQFAKVLEGLKSETNQSNSQNNNLSSSKNNEAGSLDLKERYDILSQLLTSCLLEVESTTTEQPGKMEEDTSLSYSEEVAKKFQQVYGGGEGIPPIFSQNQQTSPPQVKAKNDDEEESNRDPAPDLVYIVFESIAAHANQLPPTSLRSCLDGKSGRIILNFMLDITGEINDGGFERVRPTAIAFDNVLPEKNKACLSNDPHFKNLKNVYNIHATSLPEFYEIITRVGLSKDFMKLRMTARRILISADMEDFEGVGENAGKLLNLAFSSNKTAHDHFSY